MTVAGSTCSGLGGHGEVSVAVGSDIGLGEEGEGGQGGCEDVMLSGVRFSIVGSKKSADVGCGCFG